MKADMCAFHQACLWEPLQKHCTMRRSSATSTATPPVQERCTVWAASGLPGDPPKHLYCTTHLVELGVAVDARHALPHDAALPQVPLVRHQQVQRAVRILRQRACV